MERWPGSDAPVVDRGTRERLMKLLLDRGTATAVQLGEALRLSPTAIRRHLDAMRAEGLVACRELPQRGRRGRGRPARVFTLTDAARESLPHTYDGLATAALRWIAGQGGPEAVKAFAAEQVSGLEARCRAAMDGAGDDPLARADALASALTAEGYAASASAISSGGQLCQRHCPVGHVAAEFPQLCEVETEVISRLVGTHVQRLATIAHGDGVCTTHIPGPRPGTRAVTRAAQAAPDSMAPDRMAPDRMAPDSMAPDSMAPDSLTTDTTTHGPNRPLARHQRAGRPGQPTV